MKNLVKLLFFILLSGCSLSPTGIEFNEITYGPCDSPKVVKFDSDVSPSGNKYLSSKFKFKERNDTIYAEIGSKFGIMYQINSEVDEDITIERVWTFPEEIINSKGEKFKEIRLKSKTKTNKDKYTVYYFEEPYEIVKGEWKLEIFYGKKLLHQRTFFIK